MHPNLEAAYAKMVICHKLLEYGLSHCFAQAMMDESAEAPSNQQLVDGSVATVAQMPAAAFPLADMLVSLCGQESGKHKQQVFKGLVQHLTDLGTPQVIAVQFAVIMRHELVQG